jgi:hypothetical protein
MTKSQKRELITLHAMHALGMHDTVARGLSALIRSAMTKSQVHELMDYAVQFGVLSHPDFIVV